MIRDDKNLEAEIENTFAMRICLSLIHSLSSIYSFTKCIQQTFIQQAPGTLQATRNMELKDGAPHCHSSGVSIPYSSWAILSQLPGFVNKF